jgi:hypothetical protein
VVIGRKKALVNLSRNKLRCLNYRFDWFAIGLE